MLKIFFILLAICNSTYAQDEPRKYCCMYKTRIPNPIFKEDNPDNGPAMLMIPAVIECSQWGAGSHAEGRINVRAESCDKYSSRYTSVPSLLLTENEKQVTELLMLNKKSNDSTLLFLEDFKNDLQLAIRLPCPLKTKTAFSQYIKAFDLQINYLNDVNNVINETFKFQKDEITKVDFQKILHSHQVKVPKYRLSYKAIQKTLPEIQDMDPFADTSVYDELHELLKTSN
jgi:hypothetical protein